MAQHEKRSKISFSNQKTDREMVVFRGQRSAITYGKLELKMN